ncbi:CRISPR-associated endonuclease Cas2 [Candidatus Giovannonibacteria bacterium RIFCSPHIGHO2_02_43_13]|uniref:CRISPR-associated endonuclease Cas2 n=1 Tax=Candidatus Giovannonibacteria bacterium RIFCSPHIGHO2_02_43_13 TaxID=1798330 RepID=A0A1F5WUV5_9BACT|nr:MAG: Repressor in ring oxydation complex/ phenylacetic acid degradation pathway related protein (PaaX) [Parcubacteria group bacterium GW2011_GWA2_44_13]OGF73188.1 MAG: CRISPR-associated endonuclease Cas2 [Candidatus Giovannonibacteria bacterium RIFCSPHIGHO2_12_FULL_44_42]OGF79435.1 MAG: CRISPR-associated endonuclease Cas2 [Candidatus Giovannonibacteria bacterium RIFCSPHIGHO2_02_43_13]OGF89297.1 MAG: CRISPR-associated endonuclease Cas2 [Candidatus Giovannonibacteria bacterium RIFCSPLOWO2_02_FU
MKRIAKAKKILSTLGEGALLTLDILDQVLITKGVLYRDRRCAAKFEPNDMELQNFYSILNRLKRDGLVEKKKKDSGMFWKITSDGLNKLKMFRENNANYESESDDKTKIIIFDIPEAQRRKRAWLREVLRRLGFKMLQQSVWIGKNKIPEDFLSDLRRYNLLAYIHILEVTKHGTVKELI